MHTALSQIRRICHTLATASILCLAAGVAIASAPRESAASFLLFESKNDGRCQNLSEGGKLALMRSTHPSRKIEFRLIRYFIDVPQNGRVTGTAEPRGDVIQLGCTLVGGRPQRWGVERASFLEEVQQ